MKHRSLRMRAMAGVLAFCLLAGCAVPGLAAYAESMDAEPTDGSVITLVPDEPEAVEPGVPVPEAEPTAAPESEAAAAAPEPDATATAEPMAAPEPDATAAAEPTAVPEPDATAAAEPTAASEPDAAATAEPTPQEPEPTFVPLVLEAQSESQSAETGTEVELWVQLNRDDVAVRYQWQRMQLPGESITAGTALYDYAEDESTQYAFLLEGTTESRHLQEYPDAMWPGIELYYAVMAALDEIGADSSDVSIAWHTENYALENYAFSAAYTADGSVEVYAEKDGERHTARLNENGQWAFGDAEPVIAGSWVDLAGAVDARYVHTVEEADRTAAFRCVITVEDEGYKAACLSILTGQGVEVPAEQLAAEQVLYSATIRLGQASTAAEDTPAEQQSAPALFGLFSLFAAARSAPAGSGSVALSADKQWITGLTGDYEYITKDAYDQVQQWLAVGRITPEQASLYWTKIGGSFKNTFEANVLDQSGLPTGATRTYRGFLLTDGKLEVNSEWYGKTVYFRVQGANGTGTAVDVPAYTTLDGAAGSLYKKAITVLNPYVPDTDPVYRNFLKTLNSNFWYAEDTHVQMYAINCETFNANPDEFLLDAEGNYRFDSVAWGVCTDDEPDLSGKAYWALKQYIGQGYGFMIGHDTLYAYAGAYYDAYGMDLDESTIDPSDGSTRYYSLNSWLPNTGHWYLNQLMGSNAGSISSGTVTPADAPSEILSAGGSHGEYGKTILYGNDELRVVETRFTAEQALASSKYRTPTNYPYAYDNGFIVDASLTHTNGQVAFGPVWVDYNGASAEFTDAGMGRLITPTVAGRQGTNNFYLSGDGNFLMNQIGHLPTNTAKSPEVRLLVNSLLYISQRKQCEICAAGQASQEDVHFVHRINSSNAAQILTALQQGGSYWYPLSDCYMLTEDITLPEGWTPIRGFTGHWSSDVYTVTLASNGAPLFAQETGTGWNLGTDPATGVTTVFDAAGSRTTGVARVVGDLRDLFSTPAQSYAGYTVRILGSDNPGYLPAGQVYSCSVNPDSKYVISNLPCVYNDATKTGILRARVYTPAGTEVTEYGVIRVNVDQMFWNTDMTTPLYLASFRADPVADAVTYESGKAVFTASAVSSDTPVFVGWQYRADSSSAWTDVPASWGTISMSDVSTLETGDQQRTAVLTLTDADPAWDGYEFRAVWSSAVHGTWSSYEFYRSGIAANLTDNGGTYQLVAETGKTGALTVKLWPARTSQGANQTVYEGGTATFISQAFVLDADGVIDVTWQYSTKDYNPVTGQYDLIWHDVAGSSSEFGSSYTVTQNQITAANGSAEAGSAWPSIRMAYSYLVSLDHSDLTVFMQNAAFYQIDTAIQISKVDILQDDTQFRVVYTAQSKYGTAYTITSDAANDVESKWVNLNADFERLGFYSTNPAAEHSNKLIVKLPELSVKMQEANRYTDSSAYADPDDALGQRLLLPDTAATVASGTAVYRALVYYLPEQVQPTITWEYRTYRHSAAKTWNQTVARALGYADVNVTITNTPKGQEVVDGTTYNVIESIMAISNAPLAMYNTETYLKYFFRCNAKASYETVKGTKTNTQVDSREGYQWGGLTMEYPISIRHNGVLGYGGTNTLSLDNFTTSSAVNSISEIAAAAQTSGQVSWMYPKLQISLPADRHVNTVVVWFDEDYPHSESDWIWYDTTRMAEYGIQASSATSQSVTFTAVTTNTVETSTWQQFLRENVVFITYDDIDYPSVSSASPSTGAKVKWYVDENKVAGVTVDPSSGKAYVVRTASSPISWTDAKNAAAAYNADLGLNGYLVEINDAAENTLVQSLLGGQDAWIGCINDSGTWKYATSGGIPPYSNWTTGSDLSYTNTYMYMKSDGTWNSSTGSTTANRTLLGAGRDYSGTWKIKSGSYVYQSGAKFSESSNSLIVGGRVTHGYCGAISNGYGSQAIDVTNYTSMSFTISNLALNWPGGWRVGVGLIDKDPATIAWNDPTYTAWVSDGGGNTRKFVYNYGTEIISTSSMAGTYTIDLRGVTGTYYPVIYFTSTSSSYGSSDPYNEVTITNIVLSGAAQLTPISSYVVEYDLDSLGMAISNHSAGDADYIGRNPAAPAGSTGKEMTVTIAGSEKIYDRQVLTPASLTVIGDEGASLGLVQVTYTLASGPYSGYTTTVVNGADWRNTGILNTGLYKATVSLTAEAQAAGWTIKSDSSNLTCDLKVLARPVDVSSTNNDKVYNGTSAGSIKNLQASIASGNRGVVAGDIVEINVSSVAGIYTSDGSTPTIHNSASNNGGAEWTMVRSSTSELYIMHTTISDPHHNYYLGKETYSGDITPRGVTVRSCYLDDPENPHNVKSYDGTADALIRYLSLTNVLAVDGIGLDRSYLTGTYATANAGEALTADGKCLPDRLKHLTEIEITRSASDPISLTGNIYGDYYIAQEIYTGAICRAILDAHVSGWIGLYGTGMETVPWAEPSYTSATISSSWLQLDGLVQGDTLILDENSLFAYDLLPNAQTSVGEYPISYTGLTETNYPVLSNYVLAVYGNLLRVTPRQILVKPDSSERITTSSWDPLHTSFALQANDGENWLSLGSDRNTAYADMSLLSGDTIQTTVQVLLPGGGSSGLVMAADGTSNIGYDTDCTIDSPARYLDPADAVVENNPHNAACSLCEEYFGFTYGTAHPPLAGYDVEINQDPAGNVLTVATVENFYGEQVANYELVYESGTIMVHPWARIQLNVTVPIQICMYGNGGDGTVVEPTNYGITNYSNCDVHIADIHVAGGWLVRDVPGIETTDPRTPDLSIYHMSANTLEAGELYLRLQRTVLSVGANITARQPDWIISHGDVLAGTGTYKPVPVTSYIGVGVNDAGESFATNVCYTVEVYIQHP